MGVGVWACRTVCGCGGGGGREGTRETGGVRLGMRAGPGPRAPNGGSARLGMRARDAKDGGYPRRSGPGNKPRNGKKPSGGLKGVRKGKRR